MRFLAVDVHYDENADSALAAGVVFDGAEAAVADEECTVDVTGIEAYVPGEFYRREMPCIQAVLEVIQSDWDVLIVDGFVDLGKKPGIGRHLYDALGGVVPVIGVAKNPFGSASAHEVFRGKSRRPLYVTAAGMPSREAAAVVRKMHGPFRIPALLSRVDSLARGRAA
jgi:deoxyribonuclease V